MRAIISVSPHPFKFRASDGTEYDAPIGGVVDARIVETSAGRHPSGVELVKTSFEASPEASALLERLEADNPGAIIAGSLIAAQAFPGRIFSPIPLPEFTRVAPPDKRYRDDKFTTF